MQGFPTRGLPQTGAEEADWSWAATSPSLGRPSVAPSRTYPGAGAPGPLFPAMGSQGLPAPLGAGAPSVMPMPGPAALGPGSTQGSMGTSGVAGVGINPVTAVTPPAATGGPHPLPSLPSLPLPQGFPNPFELQHLGQHGETSSGSQAPFSPGSTTVTGPRGYLPGLGYFGPPGQQGAPGPLAASPGSAQARPQALPQQVQAPQRPSPFWTALAWGLVNTPAARSALGDRLTRLMDGSNRMRTIQAATSLLLTPELQSAFRAVSSGQMQQTPFTSLFADRLRGALDAAGLGPGGMAG